MFFIWILLVRIVKLFLLEGHAQVIAISFMYNNYAEIWYVVDLPCIYNYLDVPILLRSFEMCP